MAIAPKVRTHDHQSLRFVNVVAEKQMQIEDELETS